MNTLKRVFKTLRLPLLLQGFKDQAAKWATERHKHFALFDGNDSLFKSLLGNASLYLEYGCGDSTIWASRYTNARIISVDTSLEWIEKVKAFSLPSNSPCIEYVNCGNVEEWGRPVDYSHRQMYMSYIQSPTMRLHDQKPDLVLIDGRFRVACFLNCLLNLEPGTPVIFDDYIGRTRYHVVEEFCQPPKIHGRQALFYVPRSIDHLSIMQELRNFAYVMD
jgi:hypothetical protein